MPIFEYNGKKYNVRDEHIDSFMKDFPDASTIMEREGKKYRVKSADYRTFMSEQQQPEQSALDSTPETPVTPSAEEMPLTEQDKIRFSANIGQMKRRTEQMIDGFNERMETMREYHENAPLGGGQTAEGKMQFNPESGKLEKTYITPLGNRYTSKGLADMESFRYRQAADMSVNGQLRRAMLKLAELQEKREASAKRVHEQWEEDTKKNTAPLGFLLAADTYVPRQMSDKENSTLDVAIRQTEELIKDLEEQKDREQGIDVGFWRGFGRVAGDFRTWDFGMSDMRDALTMMNADDLKGENATEGEREAYNEMMGALYNKGQAEQMYGGNAGFWNRAGMMTGHMPAFMLDFGITGGGFKGINVLSKAGTKAATKVVGKETVEQMAKQGFKTYVKDNGVKGLGQYATNWTIKALGTTADDLLLRAPLMTNTVQAGKTTADIIDRKLGDVVVDENGNYDFSNDKTWGNAIWQGEANAIVENYSEMFGSHLDPVVTLGNMSKLANVVGAKRIGAVLSKTDAGALDGIMGQTHQLFNKMGVSDYFGEVTEEYYGQLWRTMLNLDDAYQQNPDGTRTNLLATGQFHGDIWGGMALSMGLMGAGKATLSGVQYASMKHGVNKADARATELLGKEIWEPLRATIDLTTNDDIGSVAEGIVNDKDFSDDERAAILTYMERSLMMRGFNLGTLAQKRGGEQDEDVQSMNESYIDGYNLADPQEMTDAKNMRDYQRQRVSAIVDENTLGFLDIHPMNALEEMRNNGLWGESELETVIDYLNAKQVYDGMIQRVRDDIDARVEQSNAMVDARTNRTSGMIQGATMKQDDRRVYVVGGNLVQYADGSGIDNRASDGSIIVRDAETGALEQVSPDAVLNIDEPLNPSDEKMTAEEAIIQQFAQEASDKIDGVVTFNPGDTYTITGDDAQIQVQIVANEDGIVDNGDGTVNVSDGVNIFPLAKETIQQQADAANLARVAQFEQQRTIENAERKQEMQEAERPQYALNDIVSLTDENGVTVRGNITADADADGKYEVFTEAPINGKRVNLFTRDELDNMLLEHNGVAFEHPAENESNNGAENIPENDNNAPQNIPAMQRIPKDEQGNPLYEQADSDTAWDAIVEQTEGDEDMAQTVADGMVADKEEALKKLEKAKSKGGNSIAEKIASEKERKAAIDAAKQDLLAWQKIAGTANRRRMAADAERKRMADEAAALRKAEEEKLRAEREEAERVEREALNGVPDMVDDTPQDARARGYRRVNGHKIDRQEPLQTVQGKEVNVKFSNDVLAPGHVAVIDASLLQPSHIQGVRNPLHFIDEAQPKERNDEASGNRLVTDERYAELRERMRKKLLGQMNIGIDPEILAIGTEMAVYHLEKGSRKFAEYATAMIADLGDAIRPYLKAFYNGARDLPEVAENGLDADMTPYDEVQQFDVANFDKKSIDALATAETVTRETEVEQEAEIAQERIKKSRPARKKNEKKAVNSRNQTGGLFGDLLTENDKADAELHRQFAMTVKADMLAALDNGTKPYRSILDLRKRASELGMEVDNDGRTDILLQELVEDGLVRAAREVIERKGSASRESYDLICKLYEMQPTISARSSNRIKMQQYSTPLPMAWIAGRFAMADKADGSVLEPTAGNGMLVFTIPVGQVHVNELDKTRLDNLREQGFAQVTQQDATEPFDGDVRYDVVIANPPFGKREAVEYDGKKIPGLDPQITLNALSSMKDDGRAAIIIGGNMEYANNGAIKSMKPFFTYLYDHYNVKGVIDMGGGLYAKQGTTFPTRMILIDGRRTNEERAQTAVYPPVENKAIRKAESFDDLYEIINEVLNFNEKTNGTEVLRSQGGRHLSVADNASGETNGAGHNRQSEADDESGSQTERRGRTGLEGNSESGQRPVLGKRGQNDTVGETGRGTDTIGKPSTDGRGLEQRTVGNEPQPVDGVDVQRIGLGLKGKPKKRDLTEEKLPYRPHNTAFRLESVAPAAMVEAMDKVLSQIEAQHGSIDEFVKTELGYDTIAETYQALAAEQMDSVAMAIYQMKQEQALIIGDQTGVGKGRQMAALIRWAVQRGEKPVFITQKADLFSDIYRDLVDVGSGDLVPFIFNSDGAMVDSKGNTVHKPLSSAEMAKVFASGALPEEYDFAVLTYSQVNTGDVVSQQEMEEAAKKSGARTKKSKNVKNGKATPKATFLRAIAKDNYLFLDESHTAAGSSNTGAYLQSILRGAKAATFASATFAKRPDTMPLYAIRTAMSQAKVDPDKMISIIEKGGVTLQEIMSRELTNAGQMVRRERDMSDVVTDWKTITDPETVRRARENYDRTIAAFNAIIKFQEDYVKPMIEALDMELAVMAESAGVKRGTDKMGVENVPFASKTYNYTKQLMLALKVNAIADEVEGEINAGRHPVIALESTMESSIKDYAAGEIIDEPTFSASLLKGLDTVMQYTVKDEDGNERHERYSPQALGPAGEKAYYELQDFIRESTSDIFISPLDAIIERLNKKGYKVGELTGRNMYVERNDDGRVVVKRRTDKDKKKMQREFNSGVLDVLILNKSASTGISLHASEKFSDQRQRSMIIAQPLSDINDYMQMIGRIDRTGQVHRGYYINLGLPVPAENRFLMMLSTKLKSLNANTTTSQDSESNDVEAPDLLNKYGSQVVVEYLRDNVDIYEKMGTPLKKGGLGGGRVQASELEDYKPQEDDARKITGYVALLATKEQEEFYDDVVRRYNELIKYLNDTGSNDLKITVMPLRATTIEKRISSEGIDPDGNNPFARNSFVEKVEMDVLRKPMKADEIRKVIEQINKGVEPNTYLDNVIETIRKEDEVRIAAEDERYEKSKAKAIDDIAKQTEKINGQKKRSDEEKRVAIDNFIAETNEKVEAKHKDNILRLNTNSDQMMRRLRMFEVGKSYLVPDNLESMIFDFATSAIFCGYKTKDSKITASTTLAVFATLDGRRRIEIKLSQIDALRSIDKVTNDNWDAARATTLDNWDSQIPSETRKTGFIMTGNILQAIADTQDEYGGYPGQLISYTDIDGNVHDGILMPDKWNASMLKTSGAPLSSRLQQIKDYTPITSHDGKVEIMGNSWAKMFYLTVPKTKKDGAVYYENKTLLRAAGGNFYPYRGKLRADIPEERIIEVVKELAKLGVKVKDDTTDILQRNGIGAYNDDEVSYENDPVAKLLGQSRRTAKQRREFARRERQRMAERVESLAEKLHLDNVEVVTDASVLDGKKQRAKGFYSKSTGKITIVIPNHTSTFDVEQTLLHEAVAHYGLRQLFGEHFDTFLDNVFNNADENIRRRIVDMAAKNGWDFHKATEEYLASLAEDTEFENINASWWQQIKDFFLNMLHKIGFEDFRGVTLSDNELRYILWRSYENLAEPGRYRNILGEAADVAKQYELKVGNYAVSDPHHQTVAESDDALYRTGDPEIHERELARDRYERRVKSGMFQSQEALQDSMLGLKEAMTAILGKETNIEDVDGFENAYLGENRLSSVNKAEADAFAHTLFKPMLDEVAKLARTEAEREELTDYMMAKHGLERNTYMRNEAINNGATDADQTDYAGLTALTGMDNVADAETEAQIMVNDYEQAHDTTDLWKKVNAASKAILSKSYECGMMSKATFDKISDMYDFYIPLRGFDEKTSSEAYAYLTHKQSAFNAPIKKAEGRRSKADDPFANLQSMAEGAIMQGNRNKLVKQRFLNFALNHPSDLVSVSDIWVEYDTVADEWKPVFPDNIDSTDTPEVVERKMLDFETKMESLAQQYPDRYKHGKDTVNIPYRIVESRDMRQHQIVVKRGGRDYVITINGNPRAAQALNGQTNPDNDMSGAIGAILRAGENINRQLSAFYTTRNPDFIVSNFMRDMLYTNTMTWIRESPNYALRFHRNYMYANPVRIKQLLAKHRKGTLDMSNKTEAMFHQFMMNGGETGYANIRDIEQHKNDIRRELKKSNGKIPVKKAWDLLGGRFDEYNRAVENCARFAAFMTSREMGRSIDRAIYDAKEISVNFNKKGSGAKFYDSTGQTKAGNASALVSGLGRSGYVFWNAAIQGTANFGRQMKRHPAKAFTGIAAMFLLGAIVAYLGGDDDDDDDKNAYYNLPEYVRRSNILFRAGNSWVSIPLPVEYRAVYGMGELMISVLNGKEHLTDGEIAEAITGQATQILPIDFLEGGGGLNAFVPSAYKPLWEAYVAEKSWTGMPLYKDTPYNKDMPEWTKAYKSANKYIVGLANAMNEATGGDPYTKGTIDFNPAKIEYMLNGYFGGVFGTIDKLSKMVETVTGNREYDPRSFLLANRLVKAGDERTEYRAVNNEYFRLKEEHDRLKSRLKHYEEDTDNDIFDYAEKIDFLYNSPEYERYEIFEDYREDIDDLYNELKEAISDEERKDIEAELNELKKEMIEEMNKTRK